MNRSITRITLVGKFEREDNNSNSRLNSPRSPTMESESQEGNTRDSTATPISEIDEEMAATILSQSQRSRSSSAASSTSSITSDTTPISSPRSGSDRDPDPISSIIPKTLNLKYNFYQEDEAKNIFKNVGVVPRTVPCFVLSPTKSQQSSPPQSFNPASFLYAGHPLFLPPPAGMGLGGLGLRMPISNCNNNNDCDYLGKIGRMTCSDEPPNPAMSKVAGGLEANSTTIAKSENSTTKKLTFGIDRILAEDDRNLGCESDSEKKHPSHEDTVEEADSNPDANNSPGLKNFPISPSSLYSSSPHQLHHQHQPGISSTHCTECYLLSRYYYKIQMPLPRSLSNYGNYPWLNHQSILDNTHHQPGNNGPSYNTSSSTPSISTNFAFTPGNYAAMVSCNNGNGNGRRKRSWSRAVFSNLQRKGLEKRFTIQKYITKPDRRDLAAALGLSDAQVKVWFQNRRMKWRHTSSGKSGAEDMTITNYKATDKK